MARRLDRMYDEAVAKATTAQQALVHQLRAVRTTLPRWANQEAVQAAQQADPAAQDLLARANLAWEVVDHRRAMLLQAKGVS